MTPTPSAQTVTAEHTPTPWTSRQFDSSIVLRGPGKIQVMSTSWHCSIRASYPLKAESLANAAFVLEAVNNHATLTTSLAAAEARVVELETITQNSRDAFEFIRLTLINYLNEPERSVFWKAVKSRDACAAALSQTEEGGR